jgi:hypothetical protein
LLLDNNINISHRIAIAAGINLSANASPSSENKQTTPSATPGKQKASPNTQSTRLRCQPKRKTKAERKTIALPSQLCSLTRRRQAGRLCSEPTRKRKTEQILATNTTSALNLHITMYMLSFMH